MTNSWIAIQFRKPRFLPLFILIFFSAINLTACMVGPDFHTPAAPKVNSYTETPLPAKTASTPQAGKGGQAQYFVSGQDIPAQWWTLFHSQAINDLVSQGLANSPTLAAAKATLRQAQESLNAQIGHSYFPAVTANVAVARQRANLAFLGIEGLGGDNIFSTFNTNASVSYVLDVFGGERRTVEAARAQVDYEGFELVAAYLTLTTNIVTTAVNVASLQAQVQATQELIQDEQEDLAIIQKQYQLGGTSLTSVLSQQTQVAQTQALLPPLEQSLAEARYILDVLVGNFPNQNTLPNIDLNDLTLPAQLPLSLPSSLVRQRPDVRAAEAQLHEASAQIGVATANLFPQISLDAAYGWSAGSTNDLFGSNVNVWNIGSNLAQPLFEGGALRAQRREAIDAYAQAAAQYQQTVLQAFQNVADTLRALQHDAESLQTQQLAETSALNTLTIARKQYRLGGVSYLSVLSAAQQYQQAKINRIQAQAARYADTAALFQALGGGWWNTDLNCVGDKDTYATKS